MCDCLTHEEHLTRCGLAATAQARPAPSWSPGETAARGPRGGYFRHGRPLPPANRRSAQREEDQDAAQKGSPVLGA